MEVIESEQVEALLTYEILVPALDAQLRRDILVPQRAHHHLEYGQSFLDPTLLIMPSWKNRKYIGVKLVSIFPQNVHLPTIQGIYILMDGSTGENLAIIDAKKLTTRRTAATSAVVSKYLSRGDSRVLLIIGTGRLAPELVKAHCTVRPIDKVLIWGRNIEKATRLVEELRTCVDAEVGLCRDLSEGCAEADIISTATMSAIPVVYGQWVTPGTHIDLVGSYKPNMREGDDCLLQKANLFVDTIEGATTESGDLVIPLKKWNY